MSYGAVSADLRRLLDRVQPACAANPGAVRAYLDQLVKPVGSLGQVEELALRLTGIYGFPPRSLTRRTVLVMAADHGVAKRGVSAYPAAVTQQMCRTIARGGAAINVFAASVGAEVVLVDVGVAASVSDFGNMLHRKVRLGTRDFSKGPAMMPEETTEAIKIGSELVQTHADTNDMFGLGEIGIGNTTSAAALTAALTTTPIAQVVGSGTGVGPAGVQRKRALVAAALERLPAEPDPLHALVEVGGLEIAALVGAVLGSAIAGRAVVIDGFIAAAAALVAVRLAPPASDYLFASHRSTEPGHSVLLKSLGLRPLLELELRLGEGTGAALVFPILDVATGILRDMATFGSAGVSQSRGSE